MDPKAFLRILTSAHQHDIEHCDRNVRAIVAELSSRELRELALDRLARLTDDELREAVLDLLLRSSPNFRAAQKQHAA